MEKEYVGDLILLRGVPGSGKTTLGNIILFNIQSNIQDVLSADNFFINEKSDYVFDATKLKEAHNECQVKCAERMRNQFSKIVVANTFTQEWEMEDYYELAKNYGYTRTSVIVENRHGGESIHSVPDATLGNMRNRFQVKL